MAKQRGALRIAVGTSSANQRENLRVSSRSSLGSPLLRGLMGRSEAVQRLAAATWGEVTGGKGVVLVDGKPVDPKGGA